MQALRRAVTPSNSLSPAQEAELRSETKGPTTVGVVVSMTAVAFLFVTCRIVTRFWIIKNPGVEEFVIIIAMGASIIMAACQIEQVVYGNGTHAIFLELWQVEGIFKWLFWSIIAYSVSLTATRISILLQYHRIFTQKAMRIAIYSVMGLVVVYFLELIFTGVFTCIPVQAFWRLELQATSRCLPQQKLWYANAGINIGTDLSIAVLPLPAIWKLKLPIRQKVALMFILAIGWFVCLTSMLRLNALVNLGHTDDKTWYSPDTAYWSAVEVNVAIMCACAPTLKPLVVRAFPRWLEMSSYGNTSRASNGSSSRTRPRGSFIELERGMHKPHRESSMLQRARSLEFKRIKVTTNISQSTWFDDQDKDLPSSSTSGAGAL